MWLSILIVAGLVLVVATALAGLGPFALLFIIPGLIALAMRAKGGRASTSGADRPAPTGKTMSSTGGRRASETPQDDETLGKAHASTGFAHTGQAHMTPEQDRTTS